MNLINFIAVIGLVLAMSSVGEASVVIKATSNIINDVVNLLGFIGNGIFYACRETLIFIWRLLTGTNS